MACIPFLPRGSHPGSGPAPTNPVTEPDDQDVTCCECTGGIPAAGLARPIKAAGNFEANGGPRGATDISARINAIRLGELPAPLGDWASDQGWEVRIEDGEAPSLNRFSF